MIERHLFSSHFYRALEHTEATQPRWTGITPPESSPSRNGRDSSSITTREEEKKVQNKASQKITHPFHFYRTPARHYSTRNAEQGTLLAQPPESRKDEDLATKARVQQQNTS